MTPSRSTDDYLISGQLGDTFDLINAYIGFSFVSWSWITKLQVSVPTLTSADLIAS